MSQAAADGSFQFGSGTIIPANAGLIILDCFETLVEMRERTYIARQGVDAFIEHFSRRLRVPLAVLSDGEQSAVEAALSQAGLAGRTAAVVGAPDSLLQLPDGRVLKRLDLLLQRFSVQAEAAVFVGDSPLDAQAARHFGVPFVRVPRSEDRDFTFASLIHGPSRYQSSEFSAVFLERYLNRKK